VQRVIDREQAKSKEQLIGSKQRIESKESIESQQRAADLAMDSLPPTANGTGCSTPNRPPLQQTTSVLNAVSPFPFPFPSPSPSRFASGLFGSAAAGSAKTSLHGGVKGLDEKQAEQVATFLANNPNGPHTRIRLNSIPGKPRVTISMYDYKEDAPFKLTVDNQPYIPEGQGADVVLLQKLIGLIHDGASAADTDKLCTQLSLLYCVPNLKKRVINVMEQATVLIATDVWKKLDDLRIDNLLTQTIVNEIGACYDANQATLQRVEAETKAAIQHVEAETKGNSASLETKFASELTVTKKKIASDFTLTKMQAAHELMATKTQVAHELAKTKTDVALLENATKAEFDGTKAELAKTKTDVALLENATKAQLMATKTQVAILEQRLAATEQNQSPNPFFFYSLSQQLINEQHRQERLEPEMAKWTAAIISRMDSLPSCPGWVFRGMDMSSCFKEADVQRLFCIPGSIYTDKAFMSTSWKDSVAWDFATPNGPKPMGSVILIIKHHSGKFIKQFVAEEYKHEEEVLIKPGTQFRITNCENRGDHIISWMEKL
jgi:hypothetical protein